MQNNIRYDLVLTNVPANYEKLCICFHQTKTFWTLPQTNTVPAFLKSSCKMFNWRGPHLSRLSQPLRIPNQEFLYGPKVFSYSNIKMVISCPEYVFMNARFTVHKFFLTNFLNFLNVPNLFKLPWKYSKPLQISIYIGSLRH